MPQPKVSIGLPVYNGQRYVEVAIQSLLSQTYTDFELIICDNASTDQTANICQKYAADDARVRYTRNPTNVGANPNFNRCLELATGEYFKWAAYDDLLDPAYLARCVEMLDADPDAVLAHTRAAIVDEFGQRIDNSPAALASKGVTLAEIQDPPRDLTSPDPSVRYREILMRTKWCFEIFALYRTEPLRKADPFGDFYGVDKVLLAFMALQGTFLIAEEELFLRRYHAAKSSAKTAKQRAAWSGAKGSAGPLASQRACLRGYRRAIRQSNLSVGQKLACYKVIGRYVTQPEKWSKLLHFPGRKQAMAAIY
jgi:glycosyltransferase involved in cell wall biosynthesis